MEVHCDLSYCLCNIFYGLLCYGKKVETTKIEDEIACYLRF
ncbi:hypothetical protein MtrunA17_Chr5g0420921 [Medicago truncatula]|uniref:Uncharacterized protein n=1 Tax=Medicago truncatula TaxID=3880 RepID=A0A396HQU3_MEDTR|nr:hypothetical protein MtrunA17_Chr5g0420921 [Medicago truncatula]